MTGSSTRAPTDARWRGRPVTSLDADGDDPPFAAYQPTPDADSVQVGAVLQGGGFDNTYSLLDFIGGVVGPDGTFDASFTEGCVIRNECATSPPQEQKDADRASEGGVAWLKGVPSLVEGRVAALPINYALAFAASVRATLSAACRTASRLVCSGRQPRFLIRLMSRSITGTSPFQPRSPPV